MENIISNPDLPSVYMLPDKLERKVLPQKVMKKLGIKGKKLDLTAWHALMGELIRLLRKLALQ